MSSKRKQFKIYGPAHFAATWKKYLEICERDGTNASEQIRHYVQGQVARRDPGNPQRPITAYVEGHEDEAAARRSDLLKELLRRAELQDSKLRYREVLEAFQDRPVPGWKRVELTKSMASDLKKLGVAILY